MASSIPDKVFADVPLVNGALVLEGVGCNNDEAVPVGIDSDTIEVIVAASTPEHGTRLADLAGAYTLEGFMFAGQYAVFLDDDRVIIARDTEGALKNAGRRFN